MGSKTEIINTLTAALPVIKQKYPVNSVALFGSALREDFNPNGSDIDLLVDFTSSDFNLFLSLADELEKLFGRKVDLITKRSLKERQWDYLKDKLIYV